MHVAAILAETSVPAMVSLFFFLALFLGILVWVTVGNRHGRFTRDSRIPLQDDPVDPIDSRPAGRAACAAAKEQQHV